MVTKFIFYLLIPNLSLMQFVSKQCLENPREESLKYQEAISTKFLKDENKMLDMSHKHLPKLKSFRDYDDYQIKFGETKAEENNHKIRNQERMIMKINKMGFIEKDNLTTSVRTKKHSQDFQNEEKKLPKIIFPPANNDDVIVFKYSNEVSNIWKDITTDTQGTTFEEAHEFHDHSFNDKSTVENMPLKLNQNSTENICTYLKKNKCFEKNGVIYNPKSSISLKFGNAFRVCCILSLSTEVKVKNDLQIAKEPLKRTRRSNKQTSFNQREFLLRKQLQTPVSSSQTTRSLTKIVTPDDDSLDPYWNIKNSNFKTINKQGIKKQEAYDDYVEDYIVELPKPGLIGFYSDKEPGWSHDYENPNPPYGSNDDYSEESIGGSFGYSTIDPRRVTSLKSQKRRPIRITTEPPEEEPSFDIESQTVNFQSHPNFQVLHGFKILNLGRKSKYYNRNSKRSTTESSVENYSGERDGEEQIFKNCGKITNRRGEWDTREISEAETGSHPWLAVVVLSRRPQNVLCYATILHPRVAVTVGDCVSEYSKRTSGKDIPVLVAGLTDIKERLETQNRMVTVQMHPQWRRENLAHNLALLHWNRPLRLSASVQPACLSTSHDHDDCKFYGWGGFDQAMRQRARWQRASVVPYQECNVNFSTKSKLPADAFCATVKARGTVTGMGGSLICDTDGYATSVGVAVYRDNAIVLLPAQEWILRAMKDLKIE